MGRVKSTMIKKSATQLFEKDIKFNDSFENNKKLLKGAISYKSLRNKVAGQIVHLARKKKLKENQENKKNERREND